MKSYNFSDKIIYLICIVSIFESIDLNNKQEPHFENSICFTEVCNLRRGYYNHDGTNMSDLKIILSL